MSEKTSFEIKLQQAAGTGNLFARENMSLHTTFRTGGPADWFAAPETEEQLRDVLCLCKEEQIPCYVIGNGSNLLVLDGGYRGVILQIGRSRSAVTVEGNEIRAQAGALLSATAAKARDAALTGMECLSGIPGTIGGAVVMNAGAYGGEIKDILKWVRVLTEDGQILQLPAEELELGYRTSNILRNRQIVLEACMKLQPGDKEAICSEMERLKEQRVSKQPLEYPSAGSTFKRPEGYFAGKLIQDAGLRGYRVGGAAVSEKHCGFVINLGGASSADVLEVIRDVQNKVLELFGVNLETEVRIIGEAANVIQQ